MLAEDKKVNLTFNGKKEDESKLLTNPIFNNSTSKDKLSEMVTTILDKEFPMLKNNSLLHDLVIYTLMEKVKTVQTVENVLSYIKEKNVKQINDVHFKNGEVCIECSI